MSAPTPAQDGDGVRDAKIAELRALFEQAAKTSKATTGWNLGIIRVNGKFDRYMDPETDCAWIGFYWGFFAGRRALAKGPSHV